MDVLILLLLITPLSLYFVIFVSKCLCIVYILYSFFYSSLYILLLFIILPLNLLLSLLCCNNRINEGLSYLILSKVDTNMD